MVNISLKYSWLEGIMWQISNVYETRHPSSLEKRQHKMLKSNQIFSCVKTGYRLTIIICKKKKVICKKKMHKGIQQLSSLALLDKLVFCIKKRWFFNCQSCRITSVSSHQNKLSSCHAPVARRQLRSCTSFVFNLHNCCTSGWYISNVNYHSSVTEQHKFC